MTFKPCCTNVTNFLYKLYSITNIIISYSLYIFAFALYYNQTVFDIAFKRCCTTVNIVQNVLSPFYFYVVKLRLVKLKDFKISRRSKEAYGLDPAPSDFHNKAFDFSKFLKLLFNF